MINTCKILRVIAIRTYWAEQLIFWSKMGISAQYVRIVRIGHSYVLGSNRRAETVRMRKTRRVSRFKTVIR